MEDFCQPPAKGFRTLKKRNGRPPYEPSDKDRERVKAMTAYGIPGRLTAQLIGCGYTTLHKYYREELDDRPLRGDRYRGANRL